MFQALVCKDAEFFWQMELHGRGTGPVKIFFRISLNTVLAFKKPDLEMAVFFLLCGKSSDRDCFDTHLKKLVQNDFVCVLYAVRNKK